MRDHILQLLQRSPPDTPAATKERVSSLTAVMIANYFDKEAERKREQQRERERAPE
jgi:hypothetical protein